MKIPGNRSQQHRVSDEDKWQEARVWLIHGIFVFGEVTAGSDWTTGKYVMKETEGVAEVGEERAVVHIELFLVTEERYKPIVY